MKSADNIKRYFKEAGLDINQDADEQVFADMLRARQKIRDNVPAVPENIWRIIMKSPLAKISTAAILVIACLIGVFVIGETSSVAWAIE